MEPVGIELFRNACPVEMLQMSECMPLGYKAYRVLSNRVIMESVCWKKGKNTSDQYFDSLGDIWVISGWWPFMNSLTL